MEVDIVIIGAGPAGIQAAIHAARRKTKVLVTGRLDRSALAKAHVENMFGIPGKIDGLTILETGRKQAESFGAKFSASDVIHLKKKDIGFIAKLEDGSEVSTKSLIFALGTKRKGLKLAGADNFLGKGLSYCADCDALFFKNKDVVVVGDESAATSSAVMLCAYAKTTHLVCLNLRVSDVLKSEMQKAGVILHEGKKIVGITGTNKVEVVTLDDGNILKVDGIFVELGAKGSIELGTQIDLIPDLDGYVQVDRKMATQVPGVFACGDMTGPPLQASKAAGEGCIAGLSAAEYVKSINLDRGQPTPGVAKFESNEEWSQTEFEVTDDEIRKILKDYNTVAAVGMSTNKENANYKVPKYLMNHNYRVIPVNPNHSEIDGHKSYPALRDIPEDIDIVEIFRKSEAVDGIVEEAIAKKVKVVWMQEGIVNMDAARKAKNAGLQVVMNRCMYKEHKRIIGEA